MTELDAPQSIDLPTNCIVLDAMRIHKWYFDLSRHGHGIRVAEISCRVRMRRWFCLKAMVSMALAMCLLQ